MGLLDLLLKPIDWAVQSWDRRVNVSGRGTARLCTWDHVPIYVAGEDLAQRRQPLHLDVELELWNRGREPITLIAGELEASVDGQALQQGARLLGDPFGGATLEANGAPVNVSFELQAPEGEELNAAEGATLELRFHPTRGRRRPSLRLRVEEGGR